MMSFARTVRTGVLLPFQTYLIYCLGWWMDSLVRGIGCTVYQLVMPDQLPYSPHNLRHIALIQRHPM